MLSQYENKLHNYYYYSDLVGHSLGGNPFGLFKRAGIDFDPWITKDEYGNVIPTNEWTYDISKVHGITLWHHDSNLRYPKIDIID